LELGYNFTFKGVYREEGCGAGERHAVEHIYHNNENPLGLVMIQTPTIIQEVRFFNCPERTLEAQLS